MFQKKISNKWFYTELHPIFKIGLIYIRGDLFMIAPVLIMIFVIGIFSIKYAVLSAGVFLAVREFGELIYWLLHQFGNRKYRPYDFGFKKLENNAVYIIYQTFALVGITVGIMIAIFAILEL